MNFTAKAWLLQEDKNKLNIRMPSDSFLVQIHTSSKIITLKKLSNFKLLRNWLRDAYFELAKRIKEGNESVTEIAIPDSDSERMTLGSDDAIIIIRYDNTIVIETQGIGLSCLNREELMQVRRKISKIICEIYENGRRHHDA